MAYFAPYLDEKGIHLPTYEDRLTELSETYRSIYGSSAELSVSLPDYQLLSVLARSLDDVSALTVQAYNSCNPMYASGADLDLLLPQYGLSREDGESDASVRNRVRQFLSAACSDPEAAIVRRLMTVQYLRSARVFTNPTDTTDGRGIPPHSIAVVEQSGNAENIAQAIYDSKPPGLATYGTTTANATDSEGNPVPISFSRVSGKFIYVYLFIDTIEGADQEAIQASIVPAIVQYINSLGINSTLYVTKLYGVAYASNPAIADTYLIRDIQASIPGASAITRDSIVSEWNEYPVALNSGDTISILWNYGH